MRWQEIQECNFCGGRDAQPFLSINTSNWYDYRLLTLSKCGGCQLVRATPRPERHDLYRRHLVGTSNILNLVRKRMSRPNIIAVHRRAVEEAVRIARRPVRKLYDMGCGAGTALMGARLLGIEGEGNDVNKISVKMLTELGFQVRHGFTCQLDFSGMIFDVVLALEYFEQTYEPFEDLKRCYELLHPGGVLYARTLYLDCPDHQASGEAWPMFGAGHFYYYYPETLRMMVQAAGFKIMELKLGAMATLVALREN